MSTDRDRTLEYVALIVVVIGAIAVGYMFNWLVGLALLVVVGGLLASRLWQSTQPPDPGE